MKFPQLPLRSQQPWLEGTFWVVVTTFVIVAVAWQFASGPELPFPTGRATSLSASQAVNALLPQIPIPRSASPPRGDSRTLQTTPGGLVEVPELVQIARQLNAPDATAEDDLNLLTILLDTFHRSQSWASVPAAENEEFIAPLLGHNPHHLVLIPQDHPAINDRGQLIDRWGTPYAFHPDAAPLPEIRSAGPDRTLYTDDDVVAR